MLKDHHKDKENDSEEKEKDKNKDKNKGKDKVRPSKDKKANLINKEQKDKNRLLFRKKKTMIIVKKNKEKSFNSIERNKNEKRKTFTIEGIKNVKNFKKQIIEKIKQKEKKDKNKDKEKEKNFISNHSTFKKAIVSASNNKDYIKKKDEKRSNSYILRRGTSNSLILTKSNKYLEEGIGGAKIHRDTTKSVRDVKNRKKISKKKIDFENVLEKNKQKLQYNLFSKDKFTNTEVRNSDYVKYTLKCMSLILDIQKEKQTRVKNKVNMNFRKSKKRNKKKIALFDLDETLVHCTGDIKITKEKYQHVIEVNLPGKKIVHVGINIRPYWKQTFNLIKKNYHIVIYTASHNAYADAVLDFMDPKKKFTKYRLYRNNCCLIDVGGDSFYVKDLDIFNEYYNLKDIIIVDNSVLSFAYHLHNGIPIVPYYDEDKDGSLYVVGLYLNHIYNEEDLREANKKYINLDSFLEEAKKRKEENINEDDLDSKGGSESNDDENKENNNKINDENKEKKIENINQKNHIFNLKAIRNSIKHFSDKRVDLFIKKRSICQFSTKFLRKESNISERENNNKLKSKSKLITMYYEVNNDSSKSEKFPVKKETFGEIKRINQKRNTDIIIDEKKHNTQQTHIYIDSNNNNQDVDSKSDHTFERKKPQIDPKNEEKGLARGLTMNVDIIPEFKNKIKYQKSGKNLKSKLVFIRSNFDNKFKI